MIVVLLCNVINKSNLNYIIAPIYLTKRSSKKAKLLKNLFLQIYIPLIFFHYFILLLNDALFCVIDLNKANYDVHYKLFQGIFRPKLPL